MNWKRTLRFMLVLAVCLGSARATIGFIKTLDVWLLLTLFVGCVATLSFIVYTLASAPEPDPIQTPHTPTEDDFI